MSTVAADTHALVWYLFEQERLSPAATQALDATAEGPGALLLSAISLQERRARVPATRYNVEVAPTELQRRALDLAEAIVL